MTLLWNRVDRTLDERYSFGFKTRVFLLLNSIVFGLLGAVAWAIISHFAFDSITGAICIIGYSGIGIGFFGGIIYLYKQE